ncbi:hypothetical protein CHGG_01867 [Chaetomium globosum CBS 148.51]|uniref:Uncharacterized protein n=1 Tax=Chaetomium globosum (strain ATCC 6205 / CBS 148.51 / DSM 1962 / NBRC 6347 / NRRL 1970) TaxID=306901 RepID=Q2HD37_CHAGB|nr:uncharacterized protein CHGG_01867 [Chaetomium globosum CBS 148.51]EAQ93632.1 hypothetical protein CHGG_01867 [Chaetomium globosum CBS 148.51]
MQTTPKSTACRLGSRERPMSRNTTWVSAPSGASVKTRTCRPWRSSTTRPSRSSIILERWLLNIRLWAKEIYEDEYYYGSQLFEHNWQPRTMA